MPELRRRFNAVDLVSGLLKRTNFGTRVPFKNPRLIHCGRRYRLNVGHHVHNDRTIGLERALERLSDLCGLFNSDPERTNVLGDAGEVDHSVGPQLACLLRLLTSIGAVEAALGLISAGVVIDDGHRVDLPADRGLDFADVIPEASISGEDDDGPVGASALRAETRGKSPAEVSGAAYVALARHAQVVESTHPHPRVAGVYDDDGIIRQVLGELAAHAFGPYRNGVGLHHRLVFRIPLLAD